MSVIEDVRTLFQDLIAPDLRAISVQMAENEKRSTLRDGALATETDALSQRMDLKFEQMTALIIANHATVMNALNLEKRIADLERKQTVAA